MGSKCILYVAGLLAGLSVLMPARGTLAQCCGNFGGASAVSEATFVTQQAPVLSLARETNAPPPGWTELQASLFASRTERVFGTNVQLTYDWGTDLTAFLTVPMLYKSGNFRNPGGRYGVEDFGLGDALVGMEYRLKGGPMRRGILGEATGRFQLSFLGGLELPTGESQARQSGTEVPLNLQLGLGSMNLLGGLTAGWQEESWLWSGTALYKYYDSTREFRPGAVWSFQVAGERRVFARTSGVLRLPQLWLGMGLSGIHVGAATLSDQPVAFSAGQIAFLVPRARLYLTRHLGADFSVSIPVGADFGGTEPDFPSVSSLTLRWSF